MRHQSTFDKQCMAADTFVSATPTCTSASLMAGAWIDLSGYNGGAIMGMEAEQIANLLSGSIVMRECLDDWIDEESGDTTFAVRLDAHSTLMCRIIEALLCAAIVRLYRSPPQRDELLAQRL